MQKLLPALAAVIMGQFALAPAALAVAAQQQRMKDCNAEAKAKQLAGDERKAFMKDCLAGKLAEAKDARTAQQEKMKTCNAEATKQALKGDARKAFMKECLSKCQVPGDRVDFYGTGEGGFGTTPSLLPRVFVP